ncbi:50S ribosomal protein L14 [Candidatus Nomurabacteria bacterium RIFCSPHIGHO2_01_FULL_39_9]|uniref:Large ribosomal subunit protein uL14 n=1 Tax=Candidatus Nomurabacteria bacterium RIFCSPHIGHO2_01_FULL_39_9 TaxID=1801735 RepID=A0A1F6UVP9_9BACT|nr:MAG: 50S ribosomal protein L14 [Candidatus Nomurabacteria bacterium RIFCSPHIGHO2_01_FULL_39_9]
MVQAGTVVKITDNTGGKIGKIFKILGGSRRRYAGLGDIVVLSVKVAEPRKATKKHDVVRGVIVRQVAPHRRSDGSYIRFDDNAVVLIDKTKLEPLGTRVFGPIPKELGERGFQKIISLAAEVL